MNVPEIFRYSSLVSVPLFALITYPLIRKTPSFSLRKSAISKSIIHYTNPHYRLIFRLNFLIKALLDLSFSIYTLNHFSIAFTSVAGLCVMASAALFGSLGYFVEGTHSFLHRVFVYSSGLLWVIGYLLIVKQIASSLFLYYSVVMLVLPLTLGFLFIRKTNAFLQIICIAILYIWLITFVVFYL